METKNKTLSSSIFLQKMLLVLESFVTCNLIFFFSDKERVSSDFVYILGFIDGRAILCLIRLLSMVQRYDSNPSREP
jgi:hypothetical protein